MKRWLLNTVILAYLSTGCGTTYQVGGPPDVMTVEEAAGNLVGNDVIVVSRQGIRHRGAPVEINRDTLVLNLERRDVLFRMPASSVDHILVPDNNSTAIGAVAGILVCAPIGGVVGNSPGSRSSTGGGCNTDLGGPGAVPGTGCAGAGGALVRSGIASKTGADKYRFCEGTVLVDSVDRK